jgi:PB1 domain
MSSRNNQQYSIQLKKDVECYYCHKKRHIEAYCYKKQREKGQVECYYCHKFGHVQANCYKKKREEGHASFVEEKNNHARLFMTKTVEEKYVSKTANIPVKEKTLKTYKLIFGEDIRYGHIPIGATMSKVRDIVSYKYSGLKNFLIKYRDKEGDLVTITTVEELNLAEESADPQSSVRLYISEGMKLYYEAVVCEETQENFEFVQGELEIPNKEAIMTSIDSGNEHVKYVECLERGRKMSGLMGLIPIRSKKEDLTKEVEYNAVNVAACQAVWLKRILVDFEQVADMLTKALIRSKFEQHHSAFGVINFESRGSVEN